MASPPTAAGPTIRNPGNPDATPPPSILHLSFNQEGGSFAVGTTNGFMIFNTSPFVQIIRQDFSKNDQGGGVGVVQRIFSTNVFAVVGGGVGPELSRNKIMIWDDLMRKFTGELYFRSEVKSVRLRWDRIVAVTMQKVHVFDRTDLRLLHQIETAPNPKGLCEVALSGQMVLVCLGSDKGEVRVEHYGLSRSRLIKAHDSDVACVALSNDGRLLATASTKGTLVRVFDISDGRLLQELRRGSERAEIHSLSFSSDAEWLVASSNKGTVHVFSLNTGSRSTGTDGSQEAEQSSSPVSRLSSFKGILPKYFSSEWSVARFRVPDDIQHVVAFGQQQNTVLIIGTNGIFYRCKFDPIAGGEMTQMECHNFLHPELNS
ncbi:autophagy-related protein 18a [Sesamum indicum]|uniref:Autophagy-related protein 18a n=1 Tax=Sesamum indicum TaxID=4182 RepID=A0A6I9U597_SESIN|nr:autophagy-related protein 18a [Sesamum indicum]